MSFTVYPALDIRHGRVVRLEQGDYERETCYGQDALLKAKLLADDGAQWLHLVDLEGARTSDDSADNYVLRDIVHQIVSQTGLKVQTGGGVRTRNDVVRILDSGASRVVVGSVAIREPERVQEWLKEFGTQHITVALDARQDMQGVWRLPTHGWTEMTAFTLDDLVLDYAKVGLENLLCTDISRDGMMSGINIALYHHLHELVPDVAIQASGGVRDLNDIKAAREAGCAGVVLGRSLLEGALDLKDVLGC